MPKAVTVDNPLNPVGVPEDVRPQLPAATDIKPDQTFPAEDQQIPEGAIRVNDGLVIQNLNQKLSDANLQNSMLEAAVAQLKAEKGQLLQQLNEQATTIDDLGKQIKARQEADEEAERNKVIPLESEELPQVEEDKHG